MLVVGIGVVFSNFIGGLLVDCFGFVVVFFVFLIVVGVVIFVFVVFMFECLLGEEVV